MTRAPTAERLRRDNENSKVFTDPVPIVVADNVAHFAHAQRDHTLEDYPSLAPPWPAFFIEYPSTSGRQRRAVMVIDETDPYMGRLLDDDGPDNYTVLTELARDATADANEKFPGAEHRWMLTLIVFLDDGRNVSIIGNFMLVLDPSGAVIGNRWMLYPGIPEGIDDRWMLAAVDPALWTIALSHTRNASWEEHEPPRRRKDRYARRKGEPDPVRHHVLRLDLPRKGAGRGERTNLLDGSALHAVAGHFAHYGDCCPGRHPPRGLLFGRLTGFYWVPSHLRGSAERGVVITDFEVKPIPPPASDA